MLAQRLAKLHPHLRILTRGIKGALRQMYRRQTHQRPVAIPGQRQHPRRIARLAQGIVQRHSRAIKNGFAQMSLTQAQGRDFIGLKRALVALDHHPPHAAQAALINPFRTRHIDHIAYRHIGDPHLLTGNDQFIAIALDPRLHAARVRTDIGLGGAGTANLGAIEERRQNPFALLGRAFGIYSRGRTFVREQGNRQHRRQLLKDQAVIEHAQTTATIGFRNARCGNAQ